MFPGIPKLFDLLLILLLIIIIIPIINAIPSMLPMTIPAIAPPLGGSTIIIVGGGFGVYVLLLLVAEYVYIMRLKFFIALNDDVDVIANIRYETGSVKFTAVFSVKSIFN